MEFQDEDGQQEALKRHKARLGARYIELFVSSKDDLYQAVQQNGYYVGKEERPWRSRRAQEQPAGAVFRPGYRPPPFMPGLDFGQGYEAQPMPLPMPSLPPPPSPPIDGSSLRLRGLPFSAGVADVIAFFQGGCV